MRLLNSAFSTLLFGSLVVGCNSGPDPDPRFVTNPDVPDGNEQALSNIQAEVVATFGGESDNLDEVLSGWFYLTVGPGGQIVVMDNQTNELKSFDGEGRHLWTAFGPGEAPGEINNAGQPHFGSDGKIYLPNQGTARLDIISAEGEFETSLDFTEMGLDRPAFQGFLSDSIAVFYNWRRGSYGGLFSTVSVGDQWSFADSFFVEFENDEPADARLISWLESAAVDGSIVVPNQHAFEQRVYSPSGELMKTMTREKTGLVGIQLVESERGYGQVQYSRQQAPWVLDDEWLIVLSRWTLNWEELIDFMINPVEGTRPPADSRESLDFYTRDWELVWSLDADQISEVFNGPIYATDSAGHVYTFDTDTGMGYKYRLKVSK